MGTTKHTPPFYYIDAPHLLHKRPPQIGLAATQLGFSGSIIITTRTRSSSTNHFTYPPPYLIAAMDLAPPPVGELYVDHEELFAAANTWAGAHAYALNIKRSSKNKRGIKDKIWLKCDGGGKNSSPAEQKRLHVGSRLIECSFKAIAK